ncbi:MULTISPECIES: Hint domain-containing protein [unclassified Paracoccus (in: a-proteobacteria)]|uniref:Hint domain-containing protein n=1 Tax=unclassified Paracoccus (in: a-proteobacteria) TaxID=2688777 RepID=UPI0015FEC0AF|nr:MULTISPECIES: Hint domain-containing protein [unclassified Paracoccus (in: a-proteobacteria)]MBB1491569.1 Hint domain-containing protein [Paracoccus sp. MC1854]MBB1497546.1 Hint domain-containing protein [Paracoccus sp. MC1862]QQO43995.1 Hint domain-containing protein [Paracoccus sp. MC1862]
MATVNLLWFGNKPQFNTTPNSTATQKEADKLVGHEAFGPSEIKAVAVSGKEYNVGTWWKPDWGFATTYGSQAASAMTYASPEDGTRVSSRITGFFEVDYELTLPDETTVRQSGVLIQMANGDMFFRPSVNTLKDWDGIDGLRGVTILKAKPLPASTYPSSRTSFTAEIFDLPIVPCFTVGTMIRTGDTERPVESIAVGDLVSTRDNGLQPVRWAGRRMLSEAELAARPQLRPIRIGAGALGGGLPLQDLVVSPQHRVLVRSSIAMRMFGAPEVLVAAKQLLSLPGIEAEAGAGGVTYLHLMFDRHEVLVSNGAETESLYPGPMAIAALGAEAAAEIHAIFPGLREDEGSFPPARQLVPGRLARKLAERHGKNRVALAG